MRHNDLPTELPKYGSRGRIRTDEAFWLEGMSLNTLTTCIPCVKLYGAGSGPRTRISDLEGRNVNQLDHHARLNYFFSARHWTLGPTSFAGCLLLLENVLFPLHQAQLPLFLQELAYRLDLLVFLRFITTSNMATVDGVEPP